MKKRTFQPSFDDESRFAKIKIIARWVGRVDMPSKAFQLTILIVKVRHPTIS